MRVATRNDRFRREIEGIGPGIDRSVGAVLDIYETLRCSIDFECRSNGASGRVSLQQWDCS